ncbi:hypothetical protein TNCV_2158431 [Trichonephila clavipes]|nr:hypothetical protein TNCV_2158431 [Trichonephila clavipes]
MSPVKNYPDCIEYKASNQKPFGYYRHLCQPNVLKPWPLIFSGPYLKVKMVKDGSSSLRLQTKWVELFALPNVTAKRMCHYLD